MDHEQIQTLLEGLGFTKVYEEPPTNIQLEYPCLVWEPDSAVTTHADNIPYFHKRRYSLTMISRGPIPQDLYDKVAGLPTSTFNRFFRAANLHHNVFTAFF